MPPAPVARIAVHVQPGARRAGVVGRHADAWRVRVTAPPVDGRANAAVIELLAGALGVARRDVEVVHGSTGRRKLVAVRGLDLAEANERLAGHVG